MNILVRWETAEPIREASTIAKTTSIAREAVEQYYIITTSGFPTRLLADAPRGQQPPSGADALQAIRERLMKETALRRKGREAISPLKVSIVDGKPGATCIFLFPRAASIMAEDKEVVFATRIGQFEVKSKFNLKDMAYHGALSL